MDKQLQNSSLNVETKMANTLLKTVSSVLQGVSSSSTDSKTATTTTTTTLLKEAVIIERRKVYQNMIDGTNALAQASIVEAVAGEEESSLGDLNVKVTAGRFPSTSAKTKKTLRSRRQLNNNNNNNKNNTQQLSWSLSSATIDPNAIDINKEKESEIDLRSVTWGPKVAPFDNFQARSHVQTVHLVHSNAPNQILQVKSNVPLITLEMRTTTDPRLNGCRTLNIANNTWNNHGMITSGWYSATNTTSEDYNSNIQTAGIVLCTSSHLSDFATVDVAVEIPEANIINFESDFALIENYNLNNMQAVWVVVGLLVTFLMMCLCAARVQHKRYTRALKEFEFLNYKAGTFKIKKNEM